MKDITVYDKKSRGAVRVPDTKPIKFQRVPGGCTTVAVHVPLQVVDRIEADYPEDSLSLAIKKMLIEKYPLAELP